MKRYLFCECPPTKSTSIAFDREAISQHICVNTRIEFSSNNFFCLKHYLERRLSESLRLLE